MAQGVFEDLVRSEGLDSEVLADSAGTTSFHIGWEPDRRARQAATARGIDLGGQRARQLAPKDLSEFNYILVMDRGNYEDVLQLASSLDASAYIGMFLDYATDLPDDEVPDPYYGEGDGFERAMDLAEAASEGLLMDIKRHYLEGDRV